MQKDSNGVNELQLGGFIYILGVIFFKMDGRIPFAHAIWHLFVVLGAFIHYFAVLNNLIIPIKSEDTNNYCDASSQTCSIP